MMRKRDPNKSKNYRYQQYRPAWEEESWAEGWLSRSILDSTKAFCNVCQKQLVPGKSELQSHTKSTLHTRRINADQRSFSLKPECLNEHDVVYSKDKDGYLVITSNLHSGQDLYKLKQDLSLRCESLGHPNAEGMELAGGTEPSVSVNDILQEAQSVSEIGFTDLWDNSPMQVDTTMVVKSLASLSRNEASVPVPGVHPINFNPLNQPSSSHPQPPNQTIIITPSSSTASNPEEIISSTVKDRPKSVMAAEAVTKSGARSCAKNKKTKLTSSSSSQIENHVPSPSSSQIENHVPSPSSSRNVNSFMHHNYSRSISPFHASGSRNTDTKTTAKQKIVSSGLFSDCCCNDNTKCKLQDFQWRQYLMEKMKLKRLEQQRVRQEHKTQRLIQQYYELKMSKLLGSDDEFHGAELSP